MTSEAEREFGTEVAALIRNVAEEFSDYPCEDIALWLHSTSARRNQAELRLRRWFREVGADWEDFRRRAGR